MTFGPTHALSNATSKALRAERVIEARHVPADEQMAALARIVDEWRAEVPPAFRSRAEQRDAERATRLYDGVGPALTRAGA